MEDKSLCMKAYFFLQWNEENKNKKLLSICSFGIALQKVSKCMSFIVHLKTPFLYKNRQI